MMHTKITSNYPHWSRGASLREEPNPHSLVIDITDHPKITLFTGPAGQTNELAWEVNRALEDVFRVGRVSATGEDGCKCPLEYESHFVEDVNGRKVLKLVIKATVNDATAFPEVATEFCQKLFTKEAFPLLSRVSYSGIFGISPRPGTVFERIWISSFVASALINICYALSIIFAFYQFGSWTAECLINCFGIHSIWDDPYMYAYSYHSRLIPPSVVIFGIRLFIAIDFIVVCASLFGPIYANDFEAKIRDKELYQKLEHLDWRKKCEDTTKVANGVVCCLQQRRMGAIIASVFSWSGRLNATTPYSTATTIVIIVTGIISTVLFAVSGGYVAWRAEKRRSMVEKCGDVNNRILELWRFTTEGLEKQWSEWVTDADAADPNVILNPEFSDQMGEFGRYLAAIRDGILS
ncbi:hypothetical protein TWF128_010277 [Orbilia oligospora]|nr:hypothetical protein TWF128_010277 [Orbilia oligospora]